MGLCEYSYMIAYSMVGIEHVNPRTPSRAPAHAGARRGTRAHAGARGRTRVHAGARGRSRDIYVLPRQYSKVDKIPRLLAFFFSQISLLNRFIWPKTFLPLGVSGAPLGGAGVYSSMNESKTWRFATFYRGVGDSSKQVQSLRKQMFTHLGKPRINSQRNDMVMVSISLVAFTLFIG